MRWALQHPQSGDLRPHGIQVHHLAGEPPQEARCASALLDPARARPAIPDAGGGS